MRLLSADCCLAGAGNSSEFEVFGCKLFSFGLFRRSRSPLCLLCHLFHRRSAPLPFLQDAPLVPLPERQIFSHRLPVFCTDYLCFAPTTCVLHRLPVFCTDYLCFASTTCVLHHGTPAQQVIPPGTKTAHASFAITEFYLRINSIEGTGKGDGLSYMIEPTDPCHGALDPHSKARMRNGAVPAQVEVPLESLER